MKELWKRVLIYGSFTSMYIVTATRVQNDDNLVGFSLFSLFFFLIICLCYELNGID